MRFQMYTFFDDNNNNNSNNTLRERESYEYGTTHFPTFPNLYFALIIWTNGYAYNFCLFFVFVTQDGSTALGIAMEAGHREIGIALYAKQHILSRENSPYTLPKSKRSRSANTVMQSNNGTSCSHSPLKKSPSLQPREYATLSSMLKTRIP